MMKQNYTINLLARRSDSIEPCKDCSMQYKCDADRLACTQFRFFVNTGRVPEDTHRQPTHEIYMDVFHNEPVMTPRRDLA